MHGSVCAVVPIGTLFEVAERQPRIELTDSS
jgi:hypothetical protein